MDRVEQAVRFVFPSFKIPQVQPHTVSHPMQGRLQVSFSKPICWFLNALVYLGGPRPPFVHPSAAVGSGHGQKPV